MPINNSILKKVLPSSVATMGKAVVVIPPTFRSSMIRDVFVTTTIAGGRESMIRSIYISEN